MQLPEVTLHWTHDLKSVFHPSCRCFVRLGYNLILRNATSVAAKLPSSGISSIPLASVPTPPRFVLSSSSLYQLVPRMFGALWACARISANLSEILQTWPVR